MNDIDYPITLIDLVYFHADVVQFLYFNIQIRAIYREDSYPYRMKQHILHPFLMTSPHSFHLLGAEKATHFPHF